MAVTMRDAGADDHEPIVALALEIWEPVFASVNGALGEPLATLLHGEDWRDHQERDVRRMLTSPGAWTRVAEEHGSLLGFVAAAVVDPERAIGEMQIVGVAPAARRGGIGSALVEEALGWLRARGMRVTYLSTGGDPGHAAARAFYDDLGFTPFPNVQYFHVLEPTTP